MIIRTLMAIGILFFYNDIADATERHVWIDADPACGMGKTKDVDDCWAIIAAIRSSRLNIVGLSTVFGNINVDIATATGRRLMSTINKFDPDRSLPQIYIGAGEPIDDDPFIPPAVRELEKALMERPMMLLALGPMTNIAILLKKRPDLANRIEGIIAVAGQRPGQVFRVGNTPVFHFHDQNFRQDVDSFDIVLRSGVPIHLIPFEVGMQAAVTRTDLDSMNAKGNLDRWISMQSSEWLDFWEDTLGASGFSPFDTMAVAYLTEPRFFSCDVIPARIIRRRGLFVVRDTLEVSHSDQEGYLVKYCSRTTMASKNSITNFVSNPDQVKFEGEKSTSYF